MMLLLFSPFMTCVVVVLVVVVAVVVAVVDAVDCSNGRLLTSRENMQSRTSQSLVIPNTVLSEWSATTYDHLHCRMKG